MRPGRPTALILPIALLIGGCGPDTGSGKNAFNPATSVSQQFETFEIQNHGGMPVISRTIFYDFYRGLEPAEGADDQGIDGTTYVAARNPFDFLHHLINKDQVGTLP